MLTIGSLFSGIGGLERGLELAGLGPVRWQVERDSFCNVVLSQHWPDASRHGDVRRVGRDTLDPVDIVCGGFPCQDISVAGDGAGLAGARSGLWFEYARIVRELRPRFVVVENVGALRRRGLDRVLGDLAGAGYGSIWTSLRASDVGAPHRRERLFIVGFRRWVPIVNIDDCAECPDCGDAICPRCGIHYEGCDCLAWRDGDDDLLVGDYDLVEERWGRVAYPVRAEDSVGGGITLGNPNRAECQERQGVSGLHGEEQPSSCRANRDNAPRLPQPGLGRDLDGSSSWLDTRWPAGPFAHVAAWEPPRAVLYQENRLARLKALGNAVVPQVAAVIGTLVRSMAEAGIA